MNAIATPLNEQTKQILAQSFYYLGRGRQCFAFASQDGQYVLKLPRTDIFQIPLWLKSLPFKQCKARKMGEKQERQQFLVDSVSIAFEELKEQTALIAVHLGKSEERQRVTLVDALGSKFKFSAGKTPFVLQYKKPLLTKAFMAAQSVTEKEKILSAMLDVIAERAKKGILNRDRSFLRNYAYDGTKAYQIDVGSFFYTDGKASAKSFCDSVEPVCEWLEKIDPNRADFLKSQSAKALSRNNF